MTRFVFIIIAAYNFFLLLKAWAVASNFIGRLLPSNLLSFNRWFYMAFVAFVVIHSIRLIMFRKHSMLIQTVICSIDPFIRVFIIVFFIRSHPEADISNNGILVSQLIFFIVDISIIFYLKSKKVKEAIKHAEIWKEQQYRRRLMKKNMDNIS